MDPVSAIFERLGGPARVGAAVGVTTEHATAMRRRRSIPVRYWRALTAIDPAAGERVTYADLVAAHAPPPDASPTPAESPRPPKPLTPAGAEAKREDAAA